VLRTDQAPVVAEIASVIKKNQVILISTNLIVFMAWRRCRFPRKCLQVDKSCLS